MFFFGWLSSAHPPKQLSDTQILPKQCYSASAVRTVDNSLYPRAILCLHKPWIKGKNLQESAAHIKYFFQGEMRPIELRGSLKENKTHSTKSNIRRKASRLLQKGTPQDCTLLVFSVLMRISLGEPCFHPGRFADCHDIIIVMYFFLCVRAHVCTERKCGNQSTNCPSRKLV